MKKGEKITRKGGVFMRVHLPENGGMTTIENTFIDQFMPAASGDFVKIYLYLLRCGQSGRSDITVSQIADALNYTEADVRRAMSYWQRAGRLDLSFGADGRLKDVRVLTGGAVSEPAAAFSREASVQEDAENLHEETASQEDTVSSKITEFPASAVRSAKPSPEHAEDLRRLIFVAEQYYGRPLSRTEQDMLAWLLCDLGMDVDVIDYLLDYCISQGHTASRYIEKVAQAWHEEGVRTVEEARRQGSSRRAEYFTIFRALGIQNHTPTKPEIDFMDRWLRSYGMPMEVILQACRRTILQIGKAQFPYTDAILTAWFKGGVQTLEDVERLDRAHEEAAKHMPLRPASGRGQGSRPSGRFDNFASSGSDWDALTRQIMQTQEETSGRKTQES